jgi:S-DNA-T family DNA segregation ATPase FtsK/SpoIIIE
MAGRRAQQRDGTPILSEVEGVVCLAFGAVLVLSFASYVPDKPALNRIGPVGYWLASLLVQGFGYAAYLFPALLVAGSFALFVHRGLTRIPVRIAGAVGALLEGAILLGLYRTHVPPQLAGGWIGGFLATLMRGALGLAGSTIVLATLALLIWLMLTATPVSDMVAHVVAFALHGLRAFASGVGEGVRRGVERASGWRKQKTTVERKTSRAAAAVDDDPPVVFGQDVTVDRKKAESIIEISAPTQSKPAKKSKKDEKEQEEFVFEVDCADYQLPPVRFLGKHDDSADYADEKTLVAQSKVLEQKLGTFNVTGRVTAVRPGPVITTFEFEPEAGIKVSRVVTLCDDLTMALRAHGVRIVAPIPGKNVVGIEVSNRNRAIVGLRDLIESEDFRTLKHKLPLALGRDTVGGPVYADLGRMPHLLMAGATGTGKSVSLNAIILCLLYRCTPRDVRFIMIDPKMLELSLYEGIPHLLVPVVTDVKKAAAALANVMREMDRRFELMKDLQVRSIDDYNQRIAEQLGVGEHEDDEEDEEEEINGEEYEIEEDEEEGEEEDEENGDDEDEEIDEEEGAAREEGEGLRHEHLPRIVVVVDELADLMMTVGREVETSITRLAQKARAAGIHLIVATQRPSVDVITGLIKANFPSRISFQVTSRPDSRTILDSIGAERLLGNGDMLYLAPGTSFLHRLHGAYVTDKEARVVVEFLKKQGAPDYKMDLLEDRSKQENAEDEEEFFDELYDKAVDLVLQNGQGSTSWIQRKLGIGYNRAARIIEHMEREGVVGPADGVKPRKVLVGPTAN